ncbi:MAG TPA: tRNA (guanosine(37)-N1)-methyltransferase TrmD [bacterium]|nr:tRNA (guanosine(37)-N1)-methyltransferase TrmD [bacterium]
MHFHIITLFPEVCAPYLSTSIMRIAGEKGAFSYTLHQLADYSDNRTRRVDDRPYGGGAGTVLSVGPLDRCLSAIQSNYDAPIPIILMAPHGETLRQARLETFAKDGRDHIVVCGHYEGFDERIIALHDIEVVSVGEYVLSGGELPALTMIDGIVRLLPGVIKAESIHEESYSATLDRRREYPHYTRPESYRGLSVPEVLLGGHHKEIERYRRDNLR